MQKTKAKEGILVVAPKRPDYGTAFVFHTPRPSGEPAIPVIKIKESVNPKTDSVPNR